MPPVDRVDLRTVLEIERQVLACRRTLKFLSGEHYAERVAPWKAHLLNRPDRARPVLSYAIAEAHAANDDGTTLWLMAAYVELIEAGEDA